MRTTTRPRRGARPRLERLDDRCLPATSVGGVTATLAGGMLTVVGTEAADQIVVNINGRSARDRLGSVTVAGVGTFRLNRVSGILIGAGDGDDVVLVNARGRVATPIWIDGGRGNDVLVGSPASEVIFGGEGNDIILGRGGADQIDPGPGYNWVDGQIIDRSVPTVSPTEVVAPPPAPSPAPSPPTTAPVSPPARPSDELSAWAQRIIDLTNQQRLANGLPALAVSPALMEAARIQAEQMASLDKMQHTLPGARYPDLVSRARAVGYNYAWLGENIAFNYPDPEGVVQGWMLSSGHRANILSRDYTEIGVAVALNADGRPYFAQVFGRPA